MHRPQQPPLIIDLAPDGVTMAPEIAPKQEEQLDMGTIIEQTMVNPDITPAQQAHTFTLVIKDEPDFSGMTISMDVSPPYSKETEGEPTTAIILATIISETIANCRAAGEVARVDAALGGPPV